MTFQEINKNKHGQIELLVSLYMCSSDNSVWTCYFLLTLKNMCKVNGTKPFCVHERQTLVEIKQPIESTN